MTINIKRPQGEFKLNAISTSQIQVDLNDKTFLYFVLGFFKTV